MAFKRLGIGFAIGYVVGAKAGDKRYKEIKGRWQDLLDRPEVQRVVERGRDLARVGGRRAVGALQERFTDQPDNADRSRSRGRRDDDEPDDLRAEDDDDSELEDEEDSDIDLEDDDDQEPEDEDDSDLEDEEDSDIDLEDDDDQEPEDEDDSSLEDEDDSSLEDEDDDDQEIQGDDDSDLEDEDDSDLEDDDDEDDGDRRGFLGSVGRIAGQVRERGRVA